jgi:hypothetical protein
MALRGIHPFVHKLGTAFGRGEIRKYEMKNSDPPDEAEPTNSDENVGYGRPPTRTRLQQGRSGNPRGRPRVERHFGMALRDALKREFEIADENGVKRKMPAYDVIARGLVASAARRDRFATKQLLDQVNFYILGGVRPEDPKELKAKGLDARTILDKGWSNWRLAGAQQRRIRVAPLVH